MFSDKIQFTVPVSYSSDLEKGFRMKGIASVEEEDEQGETLEVSGMDLSDFRWVNFNHTPITSPDKIIGEVTEKKIVGKNVEVELELHEDNEEAKKVIELAKKLEESGHGNYLSLSIEGKVVERDKNNPKRVKKSKIYTVSICPTPVNRGTYVRIAKSVGLDYTENFADETDAALYSTLYRNIPQIPVKNAFNIVKSFKNNNMSMQSFWDQAKSFLTDGDKLSKGEKNDDLHAPGASAKVLATAKPVEKGNVAAEENEDMDDMEKAYDACKAYMKDDADMDVKAMRKALMKAGYSKKAIAKAIEMVIEEMEDEEEDDEMEKAKMKKSSHEADAVKKAEQVLEDFIIAKSERLVGGFAAQSKSELEEIKKAFHAVVTTQEDLIKSLKAEVSTLSEKIQHIEAQPLIKGVMAGGFFKTPGETLKKGENAGTSASVDQIASKIEKAYNPMKASEFRTSAAIFSRHYQGDDLIRFAAKDVGISIENL